VPLGDIGWQGAPTNTRKLASSLESDEEFE